MDNTESRRRINKTLIERERRLAALTKAFEPLIWALAHKSIRKAPAGMQADDLFQAGCEGLVRAFDRYDPSSAASFKTYACIRIHGAIIDEVRRQVFFCTRNAARNNVPRITRVYLDEEELFGSTDCDGVNVVSTSKQLKIIQERLARLKERDRDLFERWMWGDEGMATAGRRYGISESRVSQIVAGVRKKISKGLAVE